MIEFKLSALLRGEKNKEAKKIRSQGFIPAVIYGPGTKTRSLKLKRLDFIRVFEQAGESNLIDLTVDKGKPVKVIVKDIQKDNVKDDIIHIDFFQVDMSKKITAEIPINYIGETKAVSELGGVLVKNIDSVEVECLPEDLTDHLEIDLSKLENIGDVIRIVDLNLPGGIEATSDQNEAIASVIESRKVEEEEVEGEEVEGEEVEGEEVKEGEEAEGKEAKEGEAQTGQTGEIKDLSAQAGEAKKK